MDLLWFVLAAAVCSCAAQPDDDDGVRIIDDSDTNSGPAGRSSKESSDASAGRPESGDPKDATTRTWSSADEAQDIYETGLSILKSNNRDLTEAFEYFQKAQMLGHEKGKAEFGFALLFGFKCDQNISAAYEIFNELSKKGNLEAHLGMGFLHAAGLHVPVSKTKALVHYNIAASGGNVLAQIVLGYHYYSEVTEWNSCQKSLKYYQTIAKNVINVVCFSGRPFIRHNWLMEDLNNPDEQNEWVVPFKLKYLKHLANKDDVKAQIIVGKLYLLGDRGAPIHIQTALTYFLKAAEQENSIAFSFLGIIYLETQHNGKYNYSKAFEYFHKAAKLNNPLGQSGLGYMYLYGIYVKQSYSEALKWFTLAANEGWSDGFLYSGIMYFLGLGVKRNVTIAEKYLRLAPKLNIKKMVVLYGIAQIPPQAQDFDSCFVQIKWLKTIVEGGRWGRYSMHAYQKYLDNQFEESFVLYAFLAEMGYEVAQSNAAFLLDERYVDMFKTEEEQYNHALMYWSRAARQGNVAAQLKLGDYHYYGLGINVNYVLSAYYYYLGYKLHNDSQAMFNLGYMYEVGIGVKQDINLALKYYFLAANRSEDAQVPVFFAVIKLGLVYVVYHCYINFLNFMSMVSNEFVLFWYSWNLCLSTVLFALLCCIIYLRRPV